MKNSYKMFYLFLGLTLAVVLLIFSFLDNRLENKNKDENIAKNQSINKELSQEINVKPQEKINKNTIIEYENYYTECEHVVRSFELDKKKYIDMGRDEFRNNFKIEFSTKIIRFDSERVIVRIDKNFLCPNHYVVGEYEGYVSIYKINDKGERVLFKKLDQSIEFLSDFDKNKLKKGIIVDSIDDIGEIIENFIS
ncbi:BofC C-terminal domain-containing protein [Senegalia massiliensis]|uniref:BofC C-terminal domain-containing protein n=1 Tax=Senegalia massiliensis TaxID=1720316 RepID=UPI0010304C60|nr:BofC C-terminal domain-containing protein [Senegalia massiliensis]